jgi:hypothetical protein
MSIESMLAIYYVGSFVAFAFGILSIYHNYLSPTPATLRFGSYIFVLIILPLLSWASVFFMIAMALA